MDRSGKGTGGPELVLGIDLGGTKVAFSVADLGGRVLAHRRRPTAPSGDPARDLAALAEDARALIREAGLDPAALRGVGVSVPGPVDLDAGRVVDPPNLPGWGEVEVVAPLERAFGAPTWIDNDANAAALAEWRFGAGRGRSHLVYMTMSTGIGGGLILGGRLHRGVACSAGEVGHIPVEWDGEPCACGQRGCLEAYIGGAAWTRRLRRVTPPESLAARLAGGSGRVRPEELVEAARRGDAFARGEMERFVDYLARGIVSLSFVLAPELFVLGTIAVAAGEELCFAPLRERVRPRLWRVLRDRVEIRPAALGARTAELAGICVAYEGLAGELPRSKGGSG